jgi:triacylglycerol lipase
MFRGTTLSNYGADVVTDARLGVERSKTGLSVHIGFHHAFCSMLPEIETFLRAQQSATGTVHCIGHSLGGAVAALAADWLSAQGRSVKLYTFGAPKPGLDCFAEKLTKRVGTNNIFRVYHSTDVVPMVPVYPFSHAPTDHCGYQIPSGGFVSVAAHKITNYAKSVDNLSWLAMKNMGGKTAHETSIEQRLKSDKPINPADPRTWEWLNAGLVWVLRRLIGSAAVYLQAPIMTSMSLADKIAWILRKGIDLTMDAGAWVLNLIRKIMMALGMKLAKTVAELTEQFMRSILLRLINRMGNEAQRAVRGLMNQR